MRTDQKILLDIQQASVYVDACFILAFLDEDDPRSDTVADLIDAWREKDIKMGISAHTFAEVVGVLLKNKVERALKIYTDNLENINSQGISCLTEEDQRDIISIEAAKNLHGIREYIIQKRQEAGEESTEVLVRDILKAGKGHAEKRKLLGEYYTHSVQIFQEFIYGIEDFFKIKIETLSSDEETIAKASQYVAIYQLESHDALHLALARNKYQYFVTLDKDFIQDFHQKDKHLTTVVIPVA